MSDTTFRPMTQEEAIAFSRAARGYRLYHDVDTDRTALHQRYAEWCDSDEGRRTKVLGMDSFTVTGVPTPDGGEMEIHSIVAVLQVGEGPGAQRMVALRTKLQQADDEADRLRNKLRRVARDLEHDL